MLRKSKESHLSISVFKRPEVTEPVPRVPVCKLRSECWLVMDSGLVELRMLRLFRMTGLVDLVADAVAASSLYLESSSTSYASQIRKLVDKHQKWRAEECLNLIASENFTSHTVRQLLSGDMGHKYRADDPVYKGNRLMDQLEAVGGEL